MRAVVTGAGGFLGMRVVERLLAHGCVDIRCFLRDAHHAERLLRISDPYPNSKLEFCYGNLRSKADCSQAVADVNLIFHLAAGLKGSPAELFADSVVGSRNLLAAVESRDAISMRDTRFVLVSSFGVYGVAPLGRGARVDEQTPLEEHPELRDVYSHSKLRQEQLVREYQQKYGFELVTLRPGVIYGPGGGAFSSRIGLQIGPLFFHLGGNNLLPLTYVDNCAEAIVIAGLAPNAAGQVYNVHDNELVTAATYLNNYKRHVKRIRTLRLPFFLTATLARGVESYHRRSRGQLPAFITRYKVRTAWGGNRFDNSKLRSLGWKQIVSTPDAMKMTFAALQASENELANRAL